MKSEKTTSNLPTFHNRIDEQNLHSGITKRIFKDNVGPNGSLDNDNVVRALLQLRNTPDRDCGLSDAEVLFGRRLKDSNATPG